MAGISVDGKEQVGFGLVCDRGSRFERDEGIVFPCHDDLGSEFCFDSLLQLVGDVEHQRLLREACRADRAGVFSSVTGIDDNTHHLQAEATKSNE